MHVGKCVSGIFWFLTSRAWKQAALTALLSLALVTFGERGANAGSPTFDCSNNGQGPNMTLVIYNNTTSFNIYPVLFAGGKSNFDQWMQGCFRVANNQLAANPYPRSGQFRMYINCCDPGQNGIPPGGSVTITLPFYSPLVPPYRPDLGLPVNPNPDPSKGDSLAQFIDWWQGGGINVFVAPSTNTAPPPTVATHYVVDTKGTDLYGDPVVPPDLPPKRVNPTNNPPTSTCTGVTAAQCKLAFFSVPNSVGNRSS